MDLVRILFELTRECSLQSDQLAPVRLGLSWFSNRKFCIPGPPQSPTNRDSRSPCRTGTASGRHRLTPPDSLTVLSSHALPTCGHYTRSPGLAGPPLCQPFRHSELPGAATAEPQGCPRSALEPSGGLLTLSLTYTHIHRLTLTHTQTLTHRLTLTQTHTHTHAHTHRFMLTHRLTLTHSRSHTDPSTLALLQGSGTSPGCHQAVLCGSPWAW